MKIRYNLKNVHYALLHNNRGVISYDTPVKMPGSVSISLSQEGEQIKEYADGVTWWIGSVNSGYTGDYECEPLTKQFLIDCLGYEIDDHGVLVENGDATGNPFALLFEFDSDVREVRHILYCVTSMRPEISGSTKEDSISPEHDKISLIASPIKLGSKYIVKANTTEQTNGKAYGSWYRGVYLPAIPDDRDHGNGIITDSNAVLVSDSGSVLIYEEV